MAHTENTVQGRAQFVNNSRQLPIFCTTRFFRMKTRLFAGVLKAAVLRHIPRGTEHKIFPADGIADKHILPAQNTCFVLYGYLDVARGSQRLIGQWQTQIFKRTTFRRFGAEDLQKRSVRCKHHTVDTADNSQRGQKLLAFQEGARTGVPPNARLAELTTLIGAIQQQKEKSMPLSLEQFDERVSRANKSMDRLEAMLDSSAERQAVEEMRKEISALFEEQRRDIQMQQMRSVIDATGAGAAPAVRVDEARPRDQPVPSSVDPAIVAQQQAIAAGRASRYARDPTGASKAAQDEQREQILRQAEQERQRGNDRDAAER